MIQRTQKLLKGAFPAEREDELNSEVVYSALDTEAGFGRRENRGLKALWKF